MRRLVNLVLVALILAVVVGAVGVLMRTGLGPAFQRQACQAVVGEHTVTLTLEQAENAAIIAAIGVRRGLPARAVTIALATAYQESKILNLDYGDRDSLGLFQQRPSQGWGTPEQVQDPVYAANAFYDALERLPNYREMDINDAAQAVQRSGHPQGYRRHEENARALASALTGWSPASFTCTVRGRASADTELGPEGLTSRAAAVRDDLTTAFGPLSLGGFQPGGVSSGHMPGSAHYEGRAVDVFVRPVNEQNLRRGWVIAHYLVARADLLEIEHVIFDGKIWNVRRSDEGWRDYTPDTNGRPEGVVEILEHRDHVHVDVP
ncbi:hypothetical protein [Nocardioides limicola]|uniref:hypothetical protein n=1 Tax=Nocardioides limicola TaxID=2803368 RepID=UPI00193C81EB|nr:hypothetical protein [Nocardioides sp. DJM-14]